MANFEDTLMHENNEPGKIEIDLGFAKLVVEKGSDSAYREVYVGLQTEQGDYQDLAVIGQEYSYNEDMSVVFKPEVSIKVYADKDNEDFTHDFTIGLYDGFKCDKEQSGLSALSKQADKAAADMPEKGNKERRDPER